MSTEPLVDVKGLKKYFPLRDGLFGRTTGQLKAVDDVSFSIRKGRVFGLVGESGSGKTTVGRTLLGLHDKTAGEVMFKGQALDSLSKDALRALRPKMQIRTAR
ncbi:Glutathione import ATP-binding protein GsiA [Serratia marcescens]|nr:Glutathione import ATP-binding protein GsiA [Serratia marcescens]CAI1035613.1 Glutathione import ATP-binding protein GsiA [Serratia marcescens]